MTIVLFLHFLNGILRFGDFEEILRHIGLETLNCVIKKYSYSESRLM